MSMPRRRAELPRHPAPRGAMAKRIRHMMAATGLSDEACRKHLRDGTTPKSTLVAEAWKRGKRTLRGAA
jgi:hypothetical protein